MSLTWQTLLWWPTLPKLLLWKWQLPFGNTIQLSQTIECLEETWTWLQLYAPSRSRYATICSMLVLFFTRYLRSRHQACVSNTFKSCKSGARFLCHSTSHFIATFGGVQLTICSIVHMPYAKWVTTHVLISWALLNNIFSQSPCFSSLQMTCMDLSPQHTHRDESQRRYNGMHFIYQMMNECEWRMQGIY